MVNRSNERNSRIQHSVMKRVGIFWDYETCPLEKYENANVENAVHNIRILTRETCGSISTSIDSFRIFANVEKMPGEMRYSFFLSGVELCHVPFAGCKNALIVDAMSFAWDHSPDDALLVFVTADVRLLMVLHRLTQRRYPCALIVPSSDAWHEAFRYSSVAKMYYLDDVVKQPIPLIISGELQQQQQQQQQLQQQQQQEVKNVQQYQKNVQQQEVKNVQHQQEVKDIQQHQQYQKNAQHQQEMKNVQQYQQQMKNVQQQEVKNTQQLQQKGAYQEQRDLQHLQQQQEQIHHQQDIQQHPDPLEQQKQPTLTLSTVVGEGKRNMEAQQQHLLVRGNKGLEGPKEQVNNDEEEEEEGQGLHISSGNNSITGGEQEPLSSTSTIQSSLNQKTSSATTIANMPIADNEISCSGDCEHLPNERVMNELPQQWKNTVSVSQPQPPTVSPPLSSSFSPANNCNANSPQITGTIAASATSAADWTDEDLNNVLHVMQTIKQIEIGALSNYLLLNKLRKQTQGLKRFLSLHTDVFDVEHDNYTNKVYVKIKGYKGPAYQPNKHIVTSNEVDVNVIVDALRANRGPMQIGALSSKLVSLGYNPQGLKQYLQQHSEVFEFEMPKQNSLYVRLKISS